MVIASLLFVRELAYHTIGLKYDLRLQETGMTNSNGKAQIVVKNANIMTMDGDQPKAESLAMAHGRFVGVGSNEDIEGLIGPGTKVVEMGGKTVLPGFIDGHIHVLNSGVRHVMAADCDVPTLNQVQTALKERAEKTPTSEWVQGFKFDDTKTDRTSSNEGYHLHRDDLDAVTKDHPVLVAHRAGHVFYMNTAGLEAAGYSDDTPDPPGGRLGRDPHSGHLNGMVFERAIDHVRFGLIPVETEETRRQGLRTICNMLNRVGLTSVHDARVTAEEFQTYQDGKSAGELSLRVYALMWYPQFPALRDAGIKVIEGVLETEAVLLNAVHFKFHRAGTPFITLKVAQSIDGRIATDEGDSRWISDHEARVMVHELRACHDAIMVGIETALTDDPELTVRLATPLRDRPPLPIVIDSTLRLPKNARMLSGERPPQVFTTERHDLNARAALEHAGARVTVVGSTKDGKVSLDQALTTLAETGVTSLLVEGGAALHSEFIRLRLFDKLVAVVAPIIIGTGTESVGDLRISQLIDALRLERVSHQQINDQAVISGYRSIASTVGQTNKMQPQESGCSAVS